MSLILEALRKSEAERQLGRAPGLLSPMATAPRRRSGWWMVAIGVPLLLAVAVAGWWAGRGGWLPTSEIDPVGVAPADPDVDPLAAAEAVRPAPVSAPPVPAAAPVARPATAPSTVADRAAPTATAPAPRSDAVATPPRPSAQAASGSDPAAPAVAPETPLPRAAVEPATTPPNPVDPAATAAAVVERQLPAPPSLATLAPDVRARLPALRMSLHVFADQPAQRFALIDGRRYSEGQRIADGVAVAEIRRDGVVLAVDGRHFLLPRP